MESLQNEPNRPFRILDYVVIYLTADMVSTGFIGSLMGLAGAGFALLFGMFFWWMYEIYVRIQIRKGHR